ncbi:MAG: DUF1917 domain-containing protein [Anaerolineae bacterium]|nr:DUF1917 domain-containing protein [Anaerolineae bacterium]
MADSKPVPPNLDLIQIVQQARMLHDAQTTPSQISGVYWLECKPSSPGQTPTARAGEWRIETTLAEVDSLWAIIKQATEAGFLGYKSKVSTAPAHGQTQTDARLIVVRTYDADDTADVARVEAALRERGIQTGRYEQI